MSSHESLSASISLNVVPARTGMTWVKQGIKTFFKQPFALGGLVLMNFGISQLLAILPLIGVFAAVALIPAFNLGLLAASRSANDGVFPKLMTLFEAFRSGPTKTKQMLALGGLYTLGMLLVVSVFVYFFGLQPEGLPAADSANLEKVIVKDEFLVAIAAALIVYIPLSVTFWHAPALVYWHGISPVKALFFSTVACLRNFGAMMVYFFTWLAVLWLGGLVIAILAAVIGAESNLILIVVPLALLIISMFFCSIYFTFKDSFILNNREYINIVDVSKQ
jgi:hypothetical protein